MSAVDKTGWDPKKCWAESKKRPGDQCRNYPLRGSSTCIRHGSGSKKARAAAARNVATAKAQARIDRLANRLGAPIDHEDTAQYILDQIALKAGEVEWLQHQIDQLDSDNDLFWGTTKHVTGEGPEGYVDQTTEEAGQHVIYQLLHKAQDQRVKYAAEALKAGVEERQVRISEKTGEQFEAVITALLPAIGATPEQMKLAAAEIPRILRNVGAAK